MSLSLSHLLLENLGQAQFLGDILAPWPLSSHLCILNPFRKSHESLACTPTVMSSVHLFSTNSIGNRLWASDNSVNVLDFSIHSPISFSHLRIKYALTSTGTRLSSSLLCLPILVVLFQGLVHMNVNQLK